MGTLHCALENGADLYVNECQKIRQYRARSAEERRKNAKNGDFFYYAWCVHKLHYYGNVIHSFECESAVEHDGGV